MMPILISFSTGSRWREFARRQRTSSDLVSSDKTQILGLFYWYALKRGQHTEKRTKMLRLTLLRWQSPSIPIKYPALGELNLLALSSGEMGLGLDSNAQFVKQQNLVT